MTNNKNPCIEWPKKSRLGYGIIWFKSNRNFVLAHRIAWVYEHGEIPEGMFLCHSCDNRACVNVDHLFLGTPQDNSSDMVAKKRQMHGEKHYNAKLSEADVKNIKESNLSSRALAKQYNVSKTNILDIKKNRIWRYV